MKMAAIKIHIETSGKPDMEKEDLKTLYAWANSQFPSGYTIYKTKGFWEKKSKESFVIERYDKDLRLHRNQKLLSSIKSLAKKLGQREVIITRYVVDSYRISTKEK